MYFLAINLMAYLGVELELHQGSNRSENSARVV